MNFVDARKEVESETKKSNIFETLSKKEQRSPTKKPREKFDKMFT